MTQMTNQQYVIVNGEKKYVGRFSNLNLDCFRIKRITDIEGLDRLKNLKILNLEENNLTEISNLEELTELEVLYLNEN